MRVRIAVSFDLPEDATREDALAYTIDAVRSYHGCYDPARDPMFFLDPDSVSATTAVTRRNHRKILRAS